MEVSLDHETRSALDIKKSGAYAYSMHPSTDLWCFAWAVGDDEPALWLPGDPVPDWAGEAPLRAWNSPFERAIWENILVPRYGFPRVPQDRWTCTASEARAMGLPGSLDAAAKALRLPIEKDDAGHRLMMRMAKPRKVLDDGTYTWWDDEERRGRLYKYCQQDVRVERAVMAHVRRLRPSERAVWLLDQDINDRGVQIDRPLVVAAVGMAQRATAAAGQVMAELTSGVVTSVTDNAGLARFLGVDSVAKDKVEAMLQDADADAVVGQVLTLRQEVGKSSVAKYAATLACACPDDRVRGALLYHGAGTGRWAGRLIQPQNYPSRGVLKHKVVERLIPFVLAGDDAGIEMVYGPCLQVLSSTLRASIIAAPGHVLMSADYANIEGRVLAWMAGEEWRVRAFRDFDTIMGYTKEGAAIRVGHDLYKLSYSRAFGTLLHEVTDAQRQIGKVMELALGYQGGVGAFQTMARGYGVEIADEKADELKVAWRAASPAIVKWWYALEAASIEAVQTGIGTARGVTFRLESSEWLSCELPSGRKIWYNRPHLRDETMPWGKVKTVLRAWGQDSVTKQWVRYSPYGGLLAENVVQAVARDIMAGAMLRLDRAGYPVVLTVHDEVVAEVPEGFGSLDEFMGLMRQTAKWADGLPVAVEGWTGKRYRK